MAFGSPTRYVQLNPNLATATAWNDAISQGNDVYATRMHNLFCDNCHSHVAYCLNLMEYKGSHSISMIYIGVWCFFCGRFTSFGAVVKTYLPFIILMSLVLYFTGSFS
jgi:hypothetical protein